MDEISTAGAQLPTPRALVPGSPSAVAAHVTSSPSVHAHAHAPMAALDAIKATFGADAAAGYRPTRNWAPSRRPPGAT